MNIIFVFYFIVRSLTSKVFFSKTIEKTLSKIFANIECFMLNNAKIYAMMKSKNEAHTSFVRISYLPTHVFLYFLLMHLIFSFFVFHSRYLFFSSRLHLQFLFLLSYHLLKNSLRLIEALDCK